MRGRAVWRLYGLSDGAISADSPHGFGLAGNSPS